MSINDDIKDRIELMTYDQLKDYMSMREFPKNFWTIKTKSQGFQPMSLLPAQLIMDNEYEKQMSERGFVRMNVLKCRQVACTTWSTRKALKYCMHNDAVTALTIAHETGLPGKWIAECKRHVEQTPSFLCPELKSSPGGSLTFSNGSSYGIGSAQGGFPGMGDCLHFRHHTEMGRWDKPPISKDPDEVLIPLDPATPTGSDIKNTVQIYESTGVMKGDWWHGKWMRGKEEDDEYVNVLLPWFLVPTYRRDDLAKDILEYTKYEQWTIKEAMRHGVDISRAQMAWRRHRIRQKPFFGKEPEFRAEYPVDENEAFMAPGETVYTHEQVDLARVTTREPIWRGQLLGNAKPDAANWRENGSSGDTWVWEWPDKRYHYVLGADCMWGDSLGADWDVLYVECLETGRVVAKMRGRYQMVDWAWKIAAMGYKYNECVVAPECNAKASTDAAGVFATLRGTVTNWAYENIWVRSDNVKLKGYRPEDFGWHTSHTSKGQLITFSQEETNMKGFDWCDDQCVDEMATIIHHADMSIGAPKGSKDDCWMARLITAMVAHRVRPSTSLYTIPTKETWKLNDLSHKIKIQLGEFDDDDDI